MNQMCKVCGEPAAGFHFGAFTCEGCKSFFGRSYNNLSSISDCKNNNDCTINKKNRTSCKACRLRKCLVVGMSKSGSRYGRRSNWFKIHCLLQEQQNATANANAQMLQSAPKTPPPHHPALGLSLPFSHPLFHHLNKTKEEMRLLGVDDYKNSASPSVSSPESHNSDSSVEISDARRLPLFLAPPFLHPHPLLFPPGYPPLYSGLLHPAPNNNNRLLQNHNTKTEEKDKRIYLDAVLKLQRAPSPELEVAPIASPIQEDPIDLSMKPASERGSSPAQSDRSGSVEQTAGSEADEESDYESERQFKRIKLMRPTPLDLTTKV